MSDNTTHTPEQVEAAKKYYHSFFRGRTRWEGRELRHDEVLVAEIERLENMVDGLIIELMEKVKKDTP